MKQRPAISPAELAALEAERDAELLAMADAISSARSWRHRKRGSEYTEIGRAVLQASTGPVGEGATLVIYQNVSGKLWAREQTEFEDGRFEEITR